MKKPARKSTPRRAKPAAPRRVDNWPGVLAAFIESRRHMPFAWGSNDCCLFACAGILTITGLDPAAKMFRGKYRDALGAARLLKKHGGVEAVAVKVCAAHGFAKVKVEHAHRGDVVMVRMKKHGPALGICLGGISAFVADSGLVFVRTLDCNRAWAVVREIGGAR